MKGEGGDGDRGGLCCDGIRVLTLIGGGFLFLAHD